MAHQITVIIPNWNGKELLRQCLLSLSAQTFKSFEVIVVDNASTDGSLEMVRQNFPSVATIALSQNYGFGRAINQGIQQARSPFLMLLNNDTVADQHCLQKLYDRLSKADAHCAAVQCRMMNYRQPMLIDSLGIRIQKDPHGMYHFDDLAQGRTLAPPFDQPGRIIGVCAGAALYRKDFFDSIGLFDERFFAVYEDVDLSFRGLRQGWYFLYEPEAVVLHHKSPTLIKLDYKKRLETVKNYYFVGLKNFPVAFLPRLFAQLLYSLQMDVFNFVSHMKKKHYWMALKIYLLILIYFLPMLINRKKTITDAELLRSIKLSTDSGIW